MSQITPYAMTFEQIAQIEGITKQGAFAVYRSALYKLRKRPGTMAALREVANELARQRMNQEHAIQRPYRKDH